MNILYYCPEYYTHQHGGRTHAREFLRALRQIPEVGKADVWSSEGAVGKKEMAQKRTVRKSGRYKQLLTFIRCFKPRYELTEELCVQINNNVYDSLIIRVAGQRNIVLSKIKRNCRHVTICMEINALRFQEEFPNIWFRRTWQKLEVMRFRNADVISVVSTHLKQYLEARGVSGDKIIVNPNGVNEEVFNGDTVIRYREQVRDRLGVPDNAVVVGYAGGMEKFRRLPEIVERIALMRRNGNTHLFLLLIGDGESMPEVRAKVAEYADLLNGWVNLTGWVEHNDVPELMAAFDIAMFPFTQPYCSPLKLFEYMGLGLPTIGPDVPAVKELFSDGEHLKLVAEDGGNFESVLTGLMRSPDERNKLAKKGRDYVLERFTWKINARRVLNALEVT